MRALSFIVVLLLIALGVLAYYREWITFGTANKEPSKTEATITIDRDKIKEDVGAAQKKAREAVTPSSTDSQKK